MRLTSVAVIVFGPVAVAGWSIHAPEKFNPGYPEVRADDPSSPSAASVREYLDARDPAIDRLLPDAAGGTRFFEDLDGNEGMAFPRVPAIGLSVTLASAGWPEAIELHERAHLLHAFLPGAVSRLMARLGRPEPAEYAATDRREHLAEMAATAWEVVAPPEHMCLEGAATDRLRDAELRVPGTAGFVAWYLRNLRPEGVAGYEELADLSASLMAPYRSEVEALGTALEGRRLSDGSFEPWDHQTVRGALEAWRAEAIDSDRWTDRIAGHLLTPSMVVLSIAGR